MRKLSHKIITAIFAVTCLFTASSTLAKGPLDQYKGKWVVVSYWADWCHFCMQEMPALNSFYNNYKNKAVVIGVNYDGLPASRLKNFKRRHGLNFPMRSRFPIYKYSRASIDHIPMTFIFNPQGKLTQVLEGAQSVRSLKRATGLS